MEMPAFAAKSYAILSRLVFDIVLKFFSLKFHGQLKNFIRLSPIFNKLEPV